MRGFLGGIVLGSVVAAIGAVVLSVVTPLPNRPEVATNAPAEVRQPTEGQTNALEPAGTDSDVVEAAPTAPVDTETAAGDLSALEGADTEPADKPAVGTDTGGLTTPEDTGQAPEVETATDTPVDPGVSVTAPQAPQDEADVSISTDPAQPVLPDVSTPSSGFGAPTETDDQAPEVAAVEEETPETPTTSDVNQPQTETAPNVDTTEAPEPSDQTPVGDATEEADDAPRIAALPQAGADATEPSGPRIGTPVVPLTERQSTEPSEESVEVPGIPPIEEFGEPFENPDAKPLMSIVLIDDAGSVGAEALLDFPYPLSFAIDPEDPKASDKMAQYRAAGFEVIALADLPSAASPQDVETALEVWFATLPEAVALMEGTGSGIQGNRALSDQVTAVVKDGGRGLITQDRGLNTVQKLAARDGVPSGVVFRDFDGAGQTPTVMRRFLDQAAFRARQQGAVIMLGRVQPDTISALLLWGLQDRASRVALAPISASLLNQPE
ncbi:MAG: polysaccharide deacteylase family 2 protein [Rhodobacteraceae bacterium]|nr:polysaccharide deacteylase family 2 protein [Paracoccaceae bacterium]